MTVRFVDAIYRFAREDKRVYDVTVEDPDDDFQFVSSTTSIRFVVCSLVMCLLLLLLLCGRIVRDLCELRCLRSRGYFGKFETELPSETYARIHSELKLCQPQICRCWLVCMWMHAVADGSEETMRRYRLVLKAYLASKFSDWLQDCASDEERKRTLQEIYEEHIDDWKLLAAALAKLEARDKASASSAAAGSAKAALAK